ncbi:hypothetical protein BDF14DRAFT_1963386 [Spinellus fusiger]|nr:hypothetical protein BDF14DRAFT_1963386 [Spinellus fusiger]
MCVCVCVCVDVDVDVDVCGYTWIWGNRSKEWICSVCCRSNQEYLGEAKCKSKEPVEELPDFSLTYRREPRDIQDALKGSEQQQEEVVGASITESMDTSTEAPAEVFLGEPIGNSVQEASVSFNSPLEAPLLEKENSSVSVVSLAPAHSKNESSSTPDSDSSSIETALVMATGPPTVTGTVTATVTAIKRSPLWLDGLIGALFTLILTLVFRRYF